MALSEEEQRLLDEMERNLYKNEADTVSVSRGPRTVNYTRVAFGLVLIAGAIALVLVGVATKLMVVGVLGFAAAVAGVLVAMSASKPAAEEPQAKGGGSGRERGAKPQANQSFMQRMSDEWDKRQGQ